MVWFVIGLGITLLPIKIAWIVAERYVYLSLLVYVLVGMVFDALLSKKRWKLPIICLGVVVVFALCARTIVRNNDWRDAEHLWVATAISSPGDPHSWNNMGDVYGNRGEYEKVLKHSNGLSRFTQITPTRIIIWDTPICR